MFPNGIDMFSYLQISAETEYKEEIIMTYYD